MPRYDYLCPECGNTEEIVMPMIFMVGRLIECDNCGKYMNRDFQAENVMVGAGRRSYSRTIVSDSMAMHPEQIPEHRRLFPDIPVTPQGQPCFDNFTDHEAYMTKCNIEKAPAKRRKKGKRIA